MKKLSAAAAELGRKGGSERLKTVYDFMVEMGGKDLYPTIEAANTTLGYEFHCPGPLDPADVRNATANGIVVVSENGINVFRLSGGDGFITSTSSGYDFFATAEEVLEAYYQPYDEESTVDRERISKLLDRENEN